MLRSEITENSENGLSRRVVRVKIDCPTMGDALREYTHLIAWLRDRLRSQEMPEDEVFKNLSVAFNIGMEAPLSDQAERKVWEHDIGSSSIS